MFATNLQNLCPPNLIRFNIFSPARALNYLHQQLSAKIYTYDLRENQLYALTLNIIYNQIDKSIKQK